MIVEEKVQKKKSFKFILPHVYTIAFGLIVFVAILTWIVPSGSFERKLVDTPAGEKMVAVANSYAPVDKIDAEGVDLRQGITAILTAPTKGVQAAADVVSFVLLIGGTFAIISKTNAINAGIGRVVKKLKGKEIVVIPIVMILFGIGGTTFGMSEEVLPFYAIFMPVFLGMGYDSMTAFMVCFLGPQLGYAASTINPFSVLIAQGVSGIHGNPQLEFRFIQWIIFMALGIIFVMMYAMKVKKNPEKSITYKDDIKKRAEFTLDENEDTHFTLRHKLVLVVFAVGMGIIIYGLIKLHWYMDEISMVFLGIGLFSGVIGGLREKEIAEEFVNGIKDFAYAAIIIGLARGILIVAESGMIIDTILNYLATMLKDIPQVVFTSVMYVVQSFIALLVPSSSGQAALTMPVLAPLCDLVGVNSEAAVTALQYSNSVTNMISPTAGMTVAGLAVCKISFGQWWKTIWKFFLLLVVVSLIFCGISAAI